MNIEVPFFGFRRYGTAIPFARLLVSDAGFSFGTMLRLFPWMSRTLTLPREEVVGVFRSRGMFSWGVGIDTIDGKTHFFWTLGPRRVLDELVERGYVAGDDRIPGSIYLMGIPRSWTRKDRRTTTPGSA